MARKIIIDTDPGQDDAVAILTALASPELEVMAITVVAGNVPLDLVTRNALMMVELAQRPDVPVYPGCARPMVRELVTAEYVHGPTGLDGVDRPDPTLRALPRHGVDALIDLLVTHEPGTITLCTLGPLTNVAMAMVKEPAIVDRIDQIVMMGGGFFEGGNVTPAAEFNIYVDPHAADVVFRSGVPIVMMPLDVTHKALTTNARIDAFRRLGTPAGDAVAGMLDFFDRYDEDKYGTEGGPLHDPCVIAYLLAPELFSGKMAHVAVEHGSELTMGMTSVDWWGVTDAEPNAMVMHGVDADRFFVLLTERIASLPGSKPSSAVDDAPTIRLVEIDESNVRAVCALAVTPEQTTMVAANAVSIAQASVASDVWMRAVYEGETPVGFVLLSDGPVDDSGAARYYVWRFMIDQRHQGRGLGRQAMRAVEDYVVARPGGDILYLSVVDTPGSAHGFYTSLGFAPTGRVMHTEVEMSKPLRR